MNKVNETPSFRVWNKETKEFIDCGRQEIQAFKIAEQIKSKVWLFYDGVACAIMSNK